jgi:hypothetical protein
MRRSYIYAGLIFGRPCGAIKTNFMKRILFIVTGYDFPRGAFSFLKDLHSQEGLHLTGLFFSPLDYQAEISASMTRTSGAYVRLQEKEKKGVDTNKETFARLCQENHLEYDIHSNEEQWDKDLVGKESRFYDLAIVSGEFFCVEADAGQPNLFLHEACRVAECPVIVVPENYQPIQRLVIAYNGSKDCVYAFKQFCYLLPQFSGLPAEVVYIRDEYSGSIPDENNLKELADGHLANVVVSKFHCRPSDYFNHPDRHSGTLFITGSYGRSGMSYLTKHSFSDLALRNHFMPVFVAHR